MAVAGKAAAVTSRKKKAYKSVLKADDIVLGLYRVGQLIAHGGFGELRIAKDIETNEHVAIKLEKSDPKLATSRLKLEYDLYKKLGESEAVPKVFYYGSCDEYSALVMELLGLSLKDLFQLCQYQFCQKTVCMIAVKCITLLEYVHSKGIVYRDVKPENFLIAKHPSQRHKFHIIDFGLAKEYRNSNTGKHIPLRSRQSIVGTIDFLSINAHLGEEQSRRDDLESLGYMLCYFLKGALPWQNHVPTGSIGRFIQNVADIKINSEIETLFEGYPDECVTYLKTVRELDYFEEPNYDYLRQLWLDIMERRNWPFDNDFDWTPNLNTISSPDE